ncbi:glycoside hydrolase family 2 protein, partial [Oharaeibacter diazotrophicus]
AVTATRDGERVQASLAIPGVARWWPASHGEPVLHAVALETAAGRVDLGRVGFRTIERDPNARGFGLRVNGVPVFCRGACWTSADVAGLAATRETYAPLLRLAAEAGMNMVRVGGTMIPESRAFFDLCDELGLMVWQEFPFANFDYPVADAAFAEAVRAEAADILDEIGPAPSLAVLCGGSEVLQQAAMMGLPPERWPGPLHDEILPAVAAERRPDVPYVPNSPSGGPLPFVPNAGVAHYYGVGAYMRPLEDARRAEVTFAAECLAFSNVPDATTLAHDLPVPAVHDPRWKAGVPRDLSASWDFEDVREHYLALLFGVDPARLRREDPALHLDLSRAVTGLVMEATFAEWRRGRSPTRGALVWTLADLAPGAGWGVIDWSGRPKPAWYALKRAFRPLQVALTDEGTNGLAIHLVNDRPEPVAATLTLACLKDGRTAVVTRERAVILAPHSATEISAFELIGAFFDVSYAYRFGPPGHDVTVARLVGADGAVLAEAFHHPLGLGHAFPRPTLSARVETDAAGARLVVATDAYAPIVHVDAGALRPDDDWFALAPGTEKVIRLVGDGPVAGEVVTPGGRSRIGFR